MRRVFWATIIGASLLLFAIPSAAKAATLFMSPSSGTLRAGEVFSATIRVNSAGTAVNASEGTIKFDPNFLTVESITSDGSIFSQHIQDPEYSNTQGTVNYVGIILNPGYNGASGTLLTVRFRARATGTTAVTFTSGAVLANDGAGTNVLTAMSGASYVIVGEQPTPAPVAEDNPAPAPSNDPSGPIITSPTHPNSERWYTSNDPRFTWILPAGVDGVSWLVAENASGNPGNRLDGLVDEVSFENVDDGIQYFHVKFQKNGAFGPIAHYEFRVDTQPPLPFIAARVEDGDDTNPQPFLTYVTSDDISGVQKYRMRIGSGDWFDVPEAPEEHPFRMPVQLPGVHPVTVEAIDASGQSARAETVITVKSITVPVIVSYPEQASSRDDFQVSGTADPHSEVTVRAWRVGPIAGFVLSDTPVDSQTVIADENGKWQMRFPRLPIGKYELIAHASDERGAISYPSDAVTVRVGNWLIRQIKSLPYWFMALPWWFQVLLLGLLGFFLWLLIFGWKRRKKKIVAVAKKDKKVKSGLEELIEDIEDELVTIARLAKSRPLYPEERYLRSKLTDYLKTLKKLAGKRPSRKKPTKPIKSAKRTK